MGIRPPYNPDIFPGQTSPAVNGRFFIVFDSFGRNRITAVFHRIASECKRSDARFSGRLQPLLTVYDTTKNGRNTVTTKWSIYGRKLPETTVYVIVFDGYGGRNHSSGLTYRDSVVYTPDRIELEQRRLSSNINTNGTFIDTFFLTLTILRPNIDDEGRYICSKGRTVFAEYDLFIIGK